MTFVKGDPRPENAGRKMGSVNKKTQFIQHLKDRNISLPDFCAAVLSHENGIQNPDIEKVDKKIVDAQVAVFKEAMSYCYKRLNNDSTTNNTLINLDLTAWLDRAEERAKELDAGREIKTINGTVHQEPT